MRTLFLTIGILSLGLFTACENKNEYTVAPEDRESFSENVYFKYDPEKKSKVSIEWIESHKEIVKKNEYNTFDDAIAAVCGENKYQAIIKAQKEEIKKVERMTKSKFYIYNDSGKLWIYFTPIDSNDLKGRTTTGRVGLIYIPHSSTFELVGTNKPAILQ